MYKALVSSHLDSIPSLQNQAGVTLNSLMTKAESIQYQADLAINGEWQGSNRPKLYEELGWESLSDRPWCRRILQVHKILNNLQSTNPYTTLFMKYNVIILGI